MQRGHEHTYRELIREWKPRNTTLTLAHAQTILYTSTLLRYLSEF